MKKLLVTGASGFLGWNLCQFAKSDWQVFGTYWTHEINFPEIHLTKIDLTNFQALRQLLETIKPDAILHLAAQSQPNFCQKNPEISYQVNVTSSVNLASLAAELQVPFVFTSTDLVFDGTNPPYTESDRVCPINLYGEHKVKAEQEILKIYPNSVICRMPLMFGRPSPTSQSFIQPFIETLKAGKPLSLFEDEMRSPVSSTTAAQGILLALEKCRGEILHLGGKESVSRHQFGLIMAEQLDLPTDQITACLQADVPMAAPRPKDVSLNSTKAYGLGYQPPSLREEFNRLKKHTE
ncbi:MAG: NAD(P)-dependent oxidoreductase [Snowella sp.]|nr:NAD(P)-dependent oxidoreductase [Snowella sp.]